MKRFSFSKNMLRTQSRAIVMIPKLVGFNKRENTQKVWYFEFSVKQYTNTHIHTVKPISFCLIVKLVQNQLCKTNDSFKRYSFVEDIVGEITVD